MATITGFIEEITPRTIERRDGSGSFKAWKIRLDTDRRIFDTTRSEFASEAQNLASANQEVALDFDEEERNGFTNNKIVDVRPAGAAAFKREREPSPGSANEAVERAQQASVVYGDDRGIQIQRQTASKVAAIFFSPADDAFWQCCTELVKYFQSGVTPANTRLAQAAEEAKAQFVKTDPNPGWQPPIEDDPDSDIPF